MDSRTHVSTVLLSTEARNWSEAVECALGKDSGERVRQELLGVEVEVEQSGLLELQP